MFSGYGLLYIYIGLLFFAFWFTTLADFRKRYDDKLWREIVDATIYTLISPFVIFIMVPYYFIKDRRNK